MLGRMLTYGQLYKGLHKEFYKEGGERVASNTKTQRVKEKQEDIFAITCVFYPG